MEENIKQKAEYKLLLDSHKDFEQKNAEMAMKAKELSIEARNKTYEAEEMKKHAELTYLENSKHQ